MRARTHTCACAHHTHKHRCQTHMFTCKIYLYTTDPAHTYAYVQTELSAYAHERNKTIRFTIYTHAHTSSTCPREERGQSKSPIKKTYNKDIITRKKRYARELYTKPTTQKNGDEKRRKHLYTRQTCASLAPPSAYMKVVRSLFMTI